MSKGLRSRLMARTIRTTAFVRSDFQNINPLPYELIDLKSFFHLFSKCNVYFKKKDSKAINLQIFTKQLNTWKRTMVLRGIKPPKIILQHWQKHEPTYPYIWSHMSSFHWSKCYSQNSNVGWTLLLILLTLDQNLWLSAWNCQAKTYLTELNREGTSKPPKMVLWHFSRAL